MCKCDSSKPECWDYACACAEKNELYSLDRRIELAALILGVKEHAIKEAMSGIIPEVLQLTGEK